MEQLNSILYNIAIEGGGESVLVEWGEESSRGWVERYKAELASAERLSFIPKPGVSLPTVTVRLGEGRRWVLFSRVCGQLGGSKNLVRLYAIGWQQTVGGISVKSLQWIYPSGAVECAEEPSFVERFF